MEDKSGSSPGISVKRETIIDAAKRRFSYFGINKTTLAEIAADLDISQPLLLYYFKDKEGLMIAVFENFIRDFFETYQKRLSQTSETRDKVMSLIETKLELFEKNKQLAMRMTGTEISRFTPRLLKVLIKAQNRVADMISRQLQEGIDRRQIREVDTLKTSKIILEVLRSFETRQCLKNPIPIESDFTHQINKQKDIVKLFFEGLKLPSGQVA